MGISGRTSRSGIAKAICASGAAISIAALAMLPVTASAQSRQSDRHETRGIVAVAGESFTAKLNRLCRRGNAAARKVQNNPAEFEAVIKRYLPKFENLVPPPNKMPDYLRFVANIAVEYQALIDGNLQAATQANDRNKALAHKLNAPACA